MTKEEIKQKAVRKLAEITGIPEYRVAVLDKGELITKECAINAMLEMWNVAIDEALDSCGHVGYDVTGDSVNGISKQDLTELKIDL